MTTTSIKHGRERSGPSFPVRYRYRMYPSKDQEQFLAKSFGCARVVFNDVVAARREAYDRDLPYPKLGDLSKAMTASKKSPERAWLAEVSSQALFMSIKDADVAYQNFFAALKKQTQQKEKKDRSKGRRIGRPRFKSRKDRRQALRITGLGNFSVRKVNRDRALLRLPKMGEIPLAYSRELPSAPSSVTVVREADGRYYASFVTRESVPMLPLVEQKVGIDLGLTHLAIMAYSDGSSAKVENPRHLKKTLRKLATAQKEHARRTKSKGKGPQSANREKSRIKVATLHRKVRETRLDHHHKLARRIIDENQVIALETLSITGLGRTRMAKSIHDAGWGILTRLIEEKAQRAGRTVIRADRFFPSTRLCSECGTITEKKNLNIRFWTCGCGATHDRDINAARNLLALAAGPAERRNACREGVSLDSQEFSNPP